jgi:phenylacetate-coenzyme A ligase PaaK-like adenylate-forming protein
MMLPPMTPLDPWIRRRIGLGPGEPFACEDVRRYQLQKLRETLVYASGHSPFYRRLFSDWSDFSIVDSQAIASLPFTTAGDLARDPLAFLCISQSEVERAVTIRSSGTTGQPKRVFFNKEDLESTVDFFRHGMSTLVEAGQRVLILLPGRLPGSVGDLLVEGLARMGATGIVHGPVRDPEDAMDKILAHRAECLVGIPVQVLSLVRHPKSARIPYGSIHSVLLSTDYVPESIVAAIERTWGCTVYQHYGMTEMGYGGGVECGAHDGYHLREADLFVEIVDPVTGAPLPNGVSGEVVFTTLTRHAMPLIRYRTGDLARFLPELCPCGSTLRRLSKVQERLADGATLGPLTRLHMPVLDETIFAVPNVLDFQAELIPVNGISRLRLTLHCDPARFPDTSAEVRTALVRMPVVRDALIQGLLDIDSVRLSPENWFTTGAAKRTLIDRRQKRSIP